MIPSRRDFLKALTAGPLVLVPQRPAAVTTVNGVVFGVETFSFHDLPPAGDPQLIPTIVKNLQTLGIVECEIMSGHIEPFASVMTGWWVQSRRSADFARLREEARQWRLTVPMTSLPGHPAAIRGRGAADLPLQRQLQRDLHRRRA